MDESAGDWPHTISSAWFDEPGTPLPDSDEPVTGFHTAEAGIYIVVYHVEGIGTGRHRLRVEYGVTHALRGEARVGQRLVRTEPPSARRSEDHDAHGAAPPEVVRCLT